MNKAINDSGLPARTIGKICDVFAEFPQVEKAILYGSRAMGNYKNGSDIDLTLIGVRLTQAHRDNIADALDGLLLPYTIDLSIFAHLNHAKLCAHIERVGKVFYQGWETAELKDICDIQSGLWKGKREPFVKATVIRNTNFTGSGHLNYDNAAVIDVEERQLKNRQLRHGDIILEKSGGGEHTPVGRVCLFERNGGNYSLSNFTAYIRVKNQEQIFYRYLHYFLYSFYINGKTKPMQRYSTAIRNLQLTQYKSIVVPIPFLLKTQHIIVAKLDKVFAEIDTAIAAAQRKRNEIAQLKSALLSKYLTSTENGKNERWEVKKLGDCVDLIRGVTYDKQKQKTGETNNIILTADNITLNGDLSIVKKIYLSDDLQIGENRKLRADDIFICLASGSKKHVGKIAYISEDAGFYAGGFMGILRTKANMTGKYLFYAIRSPEVKQSFQDLVKGTNIQNLNKNILKLTLPVSPLATQKQIVAKLDKAFAELDKVDAITQTNEQNYSALKKSLLAEVFDVASEAA